VAMGTALLASGHHSSQTLYRGYKHLGSNWGTSWSVSFEKCAVVALCAALHGAGPGSAAVQNVGTVGATDLFSVGLIQADGASMRGLAVGWMDDGSQLPVGIRVLIGAMDATDGPKPAVAG